MKKKQPVQAIYSEQLHSRAVTLDTWAKSLPRPIYGKSTRIRLFNEYIRVQHADKWFKLGSDYNGVIMIVADFPDPRKTVWGRPRNKE
jgi:hypothetical protein